ncbi:MAG TPA: ABC transporter ATP-binding protein [Candidatus Treponema faecavium]|nr:ABC transporter ATP-binding protein [Candidatus Treponema faecavium]
MEHNNTSVIRKFSRLLSHRQKTEFVVLVILATLLALIETIGISAIMPFISIASNPGIVNEESIYRRIYTFLRFSDPNTFIIFFGFGIMAFYLFRAVYNVIYSYLLARYANSIFNDLSGRLFAVYLKQPYRTFLQQNASTLTNHIMGEANMSSTYLLSFLQIFPEAFTILLLYIIMLAANTRMTLILTAVLATSVAVIIRLITKINRRQGAIRSEANNKLYKTIGESFGNFKFITLRGNDADMLKRFNSINRQKTRTMIISTMMSTLPRCLIESFGFIVLIAVVVYIVWQYQSAQSVIPTISLYALSMYRILPALNRSMSSISALIYNQKAMDIVYEDLQLPVRKEGDEPVDFQRTIRADNISFSYVENKRILSRIGLTIHKGEKLAVVGESGGGKSTLIDLLIGLHTPDEGALYVDDVQITDKNIRAWRRRIGYIPQTIYLFDGTVAENISFGSEYDEARIEQILKLVRLWDMLQERDGIHTRVGDGGVQLSGGQKQRIGIARALYNEPDVLVLDEATSALDTETEAQIMQEIYQLSADKTLIVIAHRLSTIELCDRRIEIHHGELTPS